MPSGVTAIFGMSPEAAGHIVMILIMVFEAVPITVSVAGPGQIPRSRCPAT
ncbi:MAG TPA: hypothetical protein VMV17_11835 [Streptosporangiaceae bacterium]|nr:hypothetical protein [Streptosporangiaceae bacterium]